MWVPKILEVVVPSPLQDFIEREDALLVYGALGSIEVDHIDPGFIQQEFEIFVISEMRERFPRGRVRQRWDPTELSQCSEEIASRTFYSTVELSAVGLSLKDTHRRLEKRFRGREGAFFGKAFKRGINRFRRAALRAHEISLEIVRRTEQNKPNEDADPVSEE